MPTTAEKLPVLPRRANYQDVLDAPPNMVAQIIHGKLYLHARPADPHVVASAELFGEIKFRFGRRGDGDGYGPGEWRIFYEPELRLGKDVLVPDIAGWRVSNYPRNQANSHSEVVPNWVCEALFPTTRKWDLGHKSDIYAREGSEPSMDRRPRGADFASIRACRRKMGYDLDSGRGGDGLGSALRKIESSPFPTLDRRTRVAVFRLKQPVGPFAT